MAHLALADAAYYQSIIDYTKSIAHVNYCKGALLQLNNIFLSEGSWDPKAYEDALSRAWERTYSLEHPLESQMRTEPEPFAVDADPGTSTYGLDPNAPQTAPVELFQNDSSAKPALFDEPQTAPGVDVPPPLPKLDGPDVPAASEKPLEIPRTTP